MRSLKNARQLELHPGLIKYGGDKLLNRIYELVRQRGKVWPWKRPFVEKRKNNTATAAATTAAGGGGGGPAASAIAH